MIEVKLSGSLEEIRNDAMKLLDLSPALHIQNQLVLPLTEPAVKSEGTDAGKRKRRTKAEMEASSATESEKQQSDTETKTDSVAALSFDDVKTCLKKLIDTGEGGMKRAHEILTSFGTQKLSGLKEEHYVRFVEQCSTALGT